VPPDRPTDEPASGPFAARRRLVDSVRGERLTPRRPPNFSAAWDRTKRADHRLSRLRQPTGLRRRDGRGAGTGGVPLRVRGVRPRVGRVYPL